MRGGAQRRLQPNDFGLFDMQGNLWQWCHDAYAYYRLPAGGGGVEDVGDVAVVTDKSDRVNRGGSWNNPARDCRSANRYIFGPGIRYLVLGFRASRAWADK
jgi:formylglycine-generating enzyme required for sulfatase activity